MKQDRIITIAILASLLMLLPALHAVGQTMEKFNLPSQYADKANELFEKEDWRGGKAVIDQGLKNYPDDSNLHMLAGKYWLNAKNYDRARYHLVKSLNDDYNNMDAKQMLVTVEETTGNYSSAICYVNEMLEVNPYWRGLWRRKIDLYYKQGNLAESNRLFKRLLQIYPTDAALKEDYFYLLEESYFNHRNKGNTRRAADILSEMVRINPNSEEYQMTLVNHYIQLGDNDKALVQASEALAYNPGNITMLRKKVSILTELGRHTEAMAAVQTAMKANYNTPDIQKLYHEVIAETARLEHQRDPYVLYGMIYERNKGNRDALNYLMNTAISRGYDHDALYYIAQAKKVYGPTNKRILLKEFEINDRLGKDKQATAILETLYNNYPEDYDIVHNLCTRKMLEADECIYKEQWSEALTPLSFVATRSVEKELAHAANLRMLTCYTKLDRYPQADSILNILQPELAPIETTTRRAELLAKRGEHEKALALYAAAITTLPDTTELATRDKLILGYEEIAIPYIKKNTEQGLYKKAYSTTQNLLYFSPKNYLGLLYAANLSAFQGDNAGFAAYVKRGRELYPDDLAFIIKESTQMSKEGRHEEATAILYSKLEEYPGNTDLVNAFSGNSIQLALALSSEKKNSQALAALDTALVYNRNNKELKYTKGLIYEKAHEYDSAYYYQRYYEPGTLERTDYINHMKGLQNKTYKNIVDYEYIRSRYSEIDIISGVSSVGYTRKEDKISYMGRINYSGRNGSLFSGEEASNALADGDDGGTGIQLIGGASYQFNDKWTGTANIGWGHLYFPKLSATISATHYMRNEWEAEAGVGYRKLPDSGDNLLNLTGSISKTIEGFRMTANAQAIMLDSKAYYNLTFKTRYNPLTDGRTFIEAMAGAGTAPELTLIDYYSLPGAFSHLNTFVGLGGQHLLNSHIALGLSGTWHTLYDQRRLSDNTVKTQFRNLYNIYVQAVLFF